jgi:hypothetical protein
MMMNILSRDARAPKQSVAIADAAARTIKAEPVIGHASVLAVLVR